jgi:hypothetical protein
MRYLAILDLLIAAFSVENDYEEYNSGVSK